MPFLHLPVQSGSDTILTAMNRKHTSDDYRRIIERFRAAQPGIAFSSDFIVAFPGETDADFEATMQLVRDVGFASAFSFKYSSRPGTPAAAMANAVATEIAGERLQRLQALLREQQVAFNQAQVGRTLPVLFENASREDNKLFGRTPYLQAVRVPANPRLIGQEMLVTITSAGGNSLNGDLTKLAA